MLFWLEHGALRRHAVSVAVVLAAAVVVGYEARSRASVGETARSAAASGSGPAASRASLPSALTSPAAPSRVALEPVDIRPAPNPLAGLTSAELDRLARTTPVSLGSVCFGRPNRGRLFNPVALANEGGIRLMGAGENRYGTELTVRTLRAAVAEFRAAYPDAPELNVGDLSRARGGYLRPHHSHQLGVDADLGYFYTGDGKWYAKAHADNLDRELTWAFLKALIAQGAIEYVFMDRSVQFLLYAYALQHGEDPAWLSTIFESPAHRDTLVRHAYGHITHFHVRFLDPAAERVGHLLERRLSRSARR
ncbi:MAG TPA: penicillin-insensitive murein endopeptidase [Polyangiaceae bacterium]|jgi:penicillin-insensitive murein endopeptidase|nr:penicillin-insensitive murein endopeptidase [Polyangiaceae bacterium]